MRGCIGETDGRHSLRVLAEHESVHMAVKVSNDGLMEKDSSLGALQKAVETIPDDYFTDYGGGWPGEISTALIDAVFSIRAKYRALSPVAGVSGRIRSFRAAEPRVLNDLAALHALGRPRVREIMGSTITGRRLKAKAVVEAAGVFVDHGVISVDDFVSADEEAMEHAYTNVMGLGPVTFEYFSMLLGIPGVKADTMITRYVNNALRGTGHETVTGSVARTLVIEAFNTAHKGETLTHFEHALWRFQSDQN